MQKPNEINLEYRIETTPNITKRIFLLGLIGIVSAACAKPIISAMKYATFDYEFVVMKDNKIYTLREGIDSEEEKIAYNILVENKNEIVQKFVPYMEPKEKTRFLKLFDKNPNGSEAAEILKKVFDRNPELYAQAQSIGLAVKGYIDPNFYVPGYLLILSTNIALGFALRH